MEQWKKGTDHLCQFLEMRMDCAPKKKRPVEKEEPTAKPLKTPPRLEDPPLQVGRPPSSSKDTENTHEKKPMLTKKDSDDVKIKRVKETPDDRKVASPTPMRIPQKSPATSSPLLTVTTTTTKSPVPLRQSDSNPKAVNSEVLPSPRTIPKLQRGTPAQTSAETLSISSPRTLPAFPRAHTDSTGQALTSPRSLPTLAPKDNSSSPHQQIFGTPPRSTGLPKADSLPKPSKLRYDSHSKESPSSSPRSSDQKEELLRGRSQSTSSPIPSNSQSSSSSSQASKPPSQIPQSSGNSPNVNAEQVKNVLSICKESASSIMHCINQVKVSTFIFEFHFLFHVFMLGITHHSFFSPTTCYHCWPF